MPSRRRPRSAKQKPTPSLAALIASKKNPNLLLGDIQQHIVMKTKRGDDGRRRDILHPSDMAKDDWCGRADWYRLTGNAATNPREDGYFLLTIFQEGNDIHSKWQNWLAEMGVLYGDWRCEVCGKLVRAATGGLGCSGHVGQAHPPVPMAYREIPLSAEEEWLIEGHADGGVLDLHALIEIKSIGLGTIRMEEPQIVYKHTQDGVVDLDGIWKSIVRPLKPHRRQALLYLAMCRLRGLPFDRMIFIYENKGNQDVKEFVIPYNEEEADLLIQQALRVKEAVETGVLPDRPEGLTKNSKPCSSCGYRDLCWKDEEDGRATSEEGRLTPDGGSLPERPEADGAAADPAPVEAERRVPRSARRPHRTDRQRSDAAIRADDEVGGVPGDPTGRGRGGRALRPGDLGEAEGGQGAGPLDREDGDPGQGESVGGRGVRRSPREGR